MAANPLTEFTEKFISKYGRHPTIAETWNAALRFVEENGSAHNRQSAKLSPFEDNADIDDGR